MTTLEITYKPNARFGGNMICANSEMSVDITPKQRIWVEYGDQQIANNWANQILAQTINEPCTLISAKVVVTE